MKTVPEGKSEADNVEVRRGARRATLISRCSDHVDIGEGLGQLDFAAAVKISRQPLFRDEGQLARLHRALAQFMLDTHTQRARLHRGVCAVSGERRFDARHRAVAEVRGRPVPVPRARARSST